MQGLTAPEHVAYAVSRLRGDALVQVAAYIEKTDLHQPPTLDFIVEIFLSQPTVPRPAVPSPQSYSLQSTVHHPSSSSVIYSSKVHDLSTIHHPPRPYGLQPTVCYPPHTIHHPSQSTVLFSPRPFTFPAIPLVLDPPQSTIRHIRFPAIPTVLLPFLTEGLLQQAGASRAAPQYHVEPICPTCIRTSGWSVSLLLRKFPLKSLIGRSPDL
jgi:hypothetical protein